MNNNKFLKEYEMVNKIRQENNAKLNIYFAYMLDPDSDIDPWQIVGNSLANLSPVEQELTKINIIRSIETFFNSNENLKDRQEFMNKLVMRLRDIKHGVKVQESDDVIVNDKTNPIMYVLDNCRGKLPQAFLKGVENAYNNYN